MLSQGYGLKLPGIRKPWYPGSVPSSVCSPLSWGQNGQGDLHITVSQEQGYCQTALLSLLAGPHPPDQHPDS